MILELKNLVQLQEFDRAIANLKKEMAELPRKLETLIKNFEEKNKKLELIINIKKELSEKLKINSEKIDKLLEHIIKLESQENINVSTFDITNKEIEKSNLEIESLTTKNEKLNLEISDLTLEIEQLKIFLPRLREEIIEKGNSVKAELSDRQAELKKYLEQRKEQAELISSPLLKTYDTIQQKRGVSVIMPVIDVSCTGCNFKVTQQTIINLKSENNLVQCDNCSRILYLPEN